MNTLVGLVCALHLVVLHEAGWSLTSVLQKNDKYVPLPFLASTNSRWQALSLSVSMQGICTQVTDVKPQMVVATYTDAETGYEVYQQVAGTIHLIGLQGLSTRQTVETCLLR